MNGGGGPVTFLSNVFNPLLLCSERQQKTDEALQNFAETYAKLKECLETGLFPSVSAAAEPEIANEASLRQVRSVVGSSPAGSAFRGFRNTKLNAA
jgi:hypothetical protein